MVREDAGGLIGVAGVASDELVEGRPGVEHHDAEPSRPRPGDLVRFVADAGRAERVGEPSCRVDRDDAGVAPPQCRGDGERRRRRRLADPSRTAADDDRALVDDGVEGAHDSASTPAASAETRCRELRGTNLGGEQVGEFDPRQGQAVGEPGELCQLDLLPPPPEGRGAADRLGDPGSRWRPPGRRRRPGRVRVEVLEQGVATVDDERAEGDADLVLESEGGLDRFVDGGLLRDRDEDDLAAGRVGEQRDDLVGLGPQRPAAGRVGEAAGARQEAEGVAGGRRVEDDEVGDTGLLELADLAEDEDLPDPGYRRRDDIERAGAHETGGETPEAVAGEVLEQRRVRGEDPRPDASGDLLRSGPVGCLGRGGARAPREAQDRLVVAEIALVGEERREPRGVVERDDEHVEAGLGGEVRQCGARRCLADPALADDEEDVAPAQEPRDVHPAPDTTGSGAPSRVAGGLRGSKTPCQADGCGGSVTTQPARRAQVAVRRLRHRSSGRPRGDETGRGS